MLRLVLFWCAVVVATGAAVLSAQRQATSDPLSGTYTCEGKNPDRSVYTCVVNVVAVGGVYDVEWLFGSRRGAVGVGVSQGQTLSVAFFNGVNMGVTSYVRQLDGTLAGRWSIYGDPAGQVFVENLLPAGQRAD